MNLGTSRATDQLVEMVCYFVENSHSCVPGFIFYRTFRRQFSLERPNEDAKPIRGKLARPKTTLSSRTFTQSAACRTRTPTLPGQNTRVIPLSQAPAGSQRRAQKIVNIKVMYTVNTQMISEWRAARATQRSFACSQYT